MGRGYEAQCQQSFGGSGLRFLSFGFASLGVRSLPLRMWSLFERQSLAPKGSGKHIAATLTKD